ncbi:MAG TPA: hypothetical protein VG722_12190, partial [Tepidisphaeraceae bacterium]|nr:hypothetical protein [Tepidisphaeraceae bacterium]
MFRHFVCFLTIGVCFPGVLPAQRAAAPTHRYYRLICLVHLTGSGKANDPIMPEYVAEGTAIAQNSIT